MEELKFNHTGAVLGTVDNGRITLNDAGKAVILNFDSKKPTFVIPLTPITKKNSQEIRKNHKTGRRFVAPSDTFKIYQNRCFPYLYQARSIADAWKYPLNVKCLFYMPKRYRVDLVNLLEAIDDILTFYKIIPDDSFKYIGGHDGSRVLYDKDDPRTEIYFSPLQDAAESSEVIESKPHLPLQIIPE